MITRNHTGHRMGQSHQHAKLTDEQVREMRRLHDEGVGYGTLAFFFACGASTARDICKYWTRASA